MKKKPKKHKPNGKPVRYVTEYTNRWGKVMKAKDYGYKAWPFPAK